MRTFLFLLSTYSNVDHMTPLIWTCLERGDRTVVVFDHPSPDREDYRLRFLAGYPGFEVLDLPGAASPARAVRAGSRLWWTPARLQARLRASGVAACFVDWGTALGYGSGDPVRRPGLRALGGLIAGRADRGYLGRIVAWFLPPLRTNLLMAAYRAGIPRFCVPHGAWTIRNIDYTTQEDPRASRGTPPRPQKGFTVFVVAAEFQRELLVRYAGLSADVVQTWGSLRYAPEWVAIVREICPAPAWPPHWGNQTRLLLVVPKWEERVDRARTLRLLESLAGRADLALVCKGHPRLSGSLAAEAPTLARPNVWFATDAHTPALVAGTAATIVLGSSVAVEALMQGKPVIYPRFLHENRLVFDDLGGCLLARSETEVHRLVDAIARGAPPPVAAAEVRRVVSAVVYGGREPHDVPAHYYARILDHLPPAPRPA